MDAVFRSPWIVAVFAALILIEALWRRRVGRGYDAKGAAASIGVALGNIALKPLTAGAAGAAFIAAETLTPVRLPHDDWRVWLAAFFVVEFVYYWFHRWSHTVRWLWASHAVHHSAEEFTLPAAIRLGWTSFVSGGWMLFLLPVLAGFPAGMVAALMAANLTFQFALHTEAVGRLGPLEWAFNTPAHHRVHHASNAAYLDRNFGGVLIIYDRLFGTFARETPGEPIRYGLVKPVATHNPFALAFAEWRRMTRDAMAAGSWRARFDALFGRP
jgi:sterol desaturase/sphingolipid hydroxylase (fatty acid hydroxylase superfamily)